MNPIHVPSRTDTRLNILGTALSIRIHGRDTGGALSVVESYDKPGEGPPPHVHHREDETFQIIEGEYEFSVAGQTVVAKPGDTLFAPRGVAHTYRCTSGGTGRLMCVITPAGFEGFFEDIGALGPEEQADIPHVMDIAQRYGLEILPP